MLAEVVEENNKSKQFGNHFDLMKRLGVQVECIYCRFFHFQIMEFFQPWRKLRTCWNLNPMENKKHTPNPTQTAKPSRKWSSPPIPSMCQNWGKDEASLSTCHLHHPYSLSSSSSFMVPKDTRYHSLPRYASFFSYIFSLSLFSVFFSKCKCSFLGKSSCWTLSLLIIK